MKVESANPFLLRKIDNLCDKLDLKVRVRQLTDEFTWVYDFYDEDFYLDVYEDGKIVVYFERGDKKGVYEVRDYELDKLEELLR